jgi:hypothetical protein
MNSGPLLLAGNVGSEESKDEVKLRIQHQIKASMDSIYSASAVESISFSSSNSNSADSVDVQKVSSKTKEISEMVTSRLTAFLYISQKCYEEGSFSNEAQEELNDLKKSLDKTLSQCKENDDKTNEIFAKNVLDQILGLEREFFFLKSRLTKTEAEIKSTEEEEMQLKQQMHTVEGNIGKFIMETHETSNPSCKCILI